MKKIIELNGKKFVRHYRDLPEGPKEKSYSPRMKSSKMSEKSKLHVRSLTGDKHAQVALKNKMK